MARAKSSDSSGHFTATIGMEAMLWLTADKLRNNMDAAEYRHVVLGLMAGFVLANGSMSANQSGEGDARRVLFLVDRLELEDQALKAFKKVLANDYLLSASARRAMLASSAPRATSLISWSRSSSRRKTRPSLIPPAAQRAAVRCRTSCERGR